MTIKFIGVRDFRQNMAKYAKEARSTKVRYVVLNRNQPLFELKPFDEDEDLSSLYDIVVKAEHDAAAGKTISHKEMLELITHEEQC